MCSRDLYPTILDLCPSILDLCPTILDLCPTMCILDLCPTISDLCPTTCILDLCPYIKDKEKEKKPYKCKRTQLAQTHLACLVTSLLHLAHHFPGNTVTFFACVCVCVCVCAQVENSDLRQDNCAAYELINHLKEQLAEIRLAQQHQQKQQQQGQTGGAGDKETMLFPHQVTTPSANPPSSVSSTVASACACDES